MSSTRRFKLFTFAVFVAGVAMLSASVAAAAWAWLEPDVLDAFRVVLPLQAAWLFVELVRLAVSLRQPKRDDWQEPLAALMAAAQRVPDELHRALWPEAESFRQIALPPDSDAAWWLAPWRRRIALHVALPEGRQRWIVARRLRQP